MPVVEEETIWVSRYVLDPRFKYFTRPKGVNGEWKVHYTRAIDECAFHKKIVNWARQENHLEFKPAGPMQ
jgi:hypothetical protein